MEGTAVVVNVAHPPEIMPPGRFTGQPSRDGKVPLVGTRALHWWWSRQRYTQSPWSRLQIFVSQCVRGDVRVFTNH